MVDVPADVRELAVATNDFVTGLDPSIEVVPKKFYVAYKTSQNLVCMVVQKKRLFLYLKLDPKKVQGPNGISRDVSDVGHSGTGDLEVTVSAIQHLDSAKPFIEAAYQQVGG